MPLERVANKFLETLQLTDTERQGIVPICKYFHTSVLSLSERFLQSMGHHNYVTPTSYLELIASFRRLLTEKRDSVMKAKKKYVNGLDKLAFAESQVSYDKHGTENRECLSNASLFLEKSVKSGTSDFV
ncbi:dynein axonemal heavy chain 7-like [Prinia subflava]|uniref:dynein axonemal heavy chain 7-like n=1 Tax=Prinia subflava TaxID=208062 RepID=UPI002FE31874